MRTKTLIAGVLFIVLLVGLWLVNRKREALRQEEESARQVFRFDPEQVHRLTLVSSDQQIVCQRTPQGSWEMIEPLQGLADEVAVGEIISGLHDLSIERIVAEEKDIHSGQRLLSEYGLNQPEFSVHLGLEEGRLDTLVVGTKSPTTAYTFAAKTSGLQVLLVLTSSVDAIRKTLYDLRDKHLLDFETPNVTEVEIRYEDQRISCSKSGEKWHLTQPLQAPASQAEMDSVLQTIQDARITRFVAERVPDLARFGLDAPVLQVSLALGPEGRPTTLVVGAKIEVKVEREGEQQLVGYEHFAKRADHDRIFMVQAETVEALRKSPLQLRDRAVIVFEKRAVDRLELTRGGRLILCEKDTLGSWQMAAPVSAKAKDWRVNALLADLESLRAVGFVVEAPADLAPFGLIRPAVKVRLVEGGRTLGEVWFGRRKGAQVYAKGTYSDWVYLVEDDILGELEIEPKDMADTVPGAKAPGDVI